jgi:hypothetical protein
MSWYSLVKSWALLTSCSSQEVSDRILRNIAKTVRFIILFKNNKNSEKPSYQSELYKSWNDLEIKIKMMSFLGEHFIAT